jgi:hypothetical protein
MIRCRSNNSRREVILGGDFSGLFFKEFSGFEGFTMDFVESRDAVIPFEKGGRVAAELDGLGVHPPDRIEDGVIVGIEDEFLEF